MGARSFYQASKQTVSDFFGDGAMTQAAAVAFYTGLALAPLLTLLAWLSQFLGPDMQQRVVESMSQVIGQEAAQPIGRIMERADTPGMTWAGIISLIILAFSATGVFAQFQAALNRIWNVQQAPGQGVFGWLRKRALGLLMVLGILVLLLASMAVTAALSTLTAATGQDNNAWLWELLNAVGSILLFTLLFALLFKFIPDVRIGWRSVWVGAIITAVLFTLGKFLIGLYLGRSTYDSSYGAAVGSFLALLVWVYYSAVILFIGAEATQVYAHRHGHSIVPDKRAQAV